MKKILSIDGGGIRGIIPAMLMIEIEQRTGNKIAEMFDLIAGTSSGGLLALGLVKPSNDDMNLPAFSAKSLLKIYQEDGEIVFPIPYFKKINDLMNLATEKYNEEGLELVLDKHFGETLLDEAVKPVLITSYSIENRYAWFFRSERAKKDKDYNFRMKEVARATTAAPTYFEPALVKSQNEDALKNNYALIDGGVFANNPTMCAYVEARRMYEQENDFLVLSLGTGNAFKPIYYKDAKNWGLVKWVKPLIDIIFDGINNTVHYQMETLLNRNFKEKNYFRFDDTLDNEHNEIDNAGKENIQYLMDFSERLIRDNSDELNRLCELL